MASAIAFHGYRHVGCGRALSRKRKSGTPLASGRGGAWPGGSFGGGGSGSDGGGALGGFRRVFPWLSDAEDAPFLDPVLRKRAVKVKHVKRREKKSDKKKEERYKRHRQRARHRERRGHPERADARDPAGLGQCLGPGCTRPARPPSKYCSEACGIKLAANRIYEILPQRIQQWQQSPCVAEEHGKRLLERIRREQHQARLRLQEMERRFHELEGLIARAKGHPPREDEEVGTPRNPPGPLWGLPNSPELRNPLGPPNPSHKLEGLIARMKGYLTRQKFRSKIELRRFLGPGHDLSNFDFKSGLQRSGTPRTRKGPKWHLPMGPPLDPPETPREEGEEGNGAEAKEAPPLQAQAPPPPAVATPPPVEPTPLIAVAPPPPAEAPPQPEPPLVRRTRKRPPSEPPQDGTVALCASCQSLFPGVSLPPQRRCRWLCPDCRAQRRDFNREQRFYKRVGCGLCQACRIPEDCGICSACSRSSPGGPPGPAWPNKCLLRRCLRIVKKKSKAAKKTQSPQALTEKWKPPVEREPSDAPGTRHRKPLTKGKEKKKPGRPPKPSGPRRGVRSRASRRCGVCAACRRPADCGRCDFCRDKPKFGGQNLKRQKCRWRQCLRCAMRRLLPVWGGRWGTPWSGRPLPPSRPRRRWPPRPPRAAARSRRLPRPPHQ
ncbi:methyl-CpG-binding domain protein 1-like, partial [Empidonax traillii]|uniref:methyl-CpG-binding domain protein 1-like n=1 Tax=Empidonax traillii TaxID=164674 RepID=UPI000FFD4862